MRSDWPRHPDIVAFLFGLTDRVIQIWWLFCAIFPFPLFLNSLEEIITKTKNSANTFLKLFRLYLLPNRKKSHEGVFSLSLSHPSLSFMSVKVSAFSWTLYKGINTHTRSCWVHSYASRRNSRLEHLIHWNLFGDALQSFRLSADQKCTSAGT